MLRTATISALLLLFAAILPAQESPAPPIPDSRGTLELAGQQHPFFIRRLPINAFPELPAPIADELNRRGCLIPQSYQAHGPENLVRGSFEQPGSEDWALLCSAKGTVSFLVFFGSHPAEPMTLSAAPESERLQIHNAAGELSFDWGIDPVSPAHLHVLQSGMSHRPSATDHDALTDTLIDHRTICHYFIHGAWTVLPLPD